MMDNGSARSLVKQAPTAHEIVRTRLSEIEHHFGATDAHLARSRLAEAVLVVAADHRCHDIAAVGH